MLILTLFDGCLMCVLEWLTMHGMLNWWMIIGSKSILVETMECMWYCMWTCLCTADANTTCGCLMCVLEWLIMHGLSNWWMSIGSKSIWVVAMECNIYCM